MRSIKNQLMAGLAGLTMVLTISACQKGFDPKTYAPMKPLPSFGGYSSSSQIETASLVAYWPFNGNLKDSISGTAGVATGTSFTAGIAGQALQGALNGYVITSVPAAVKALHSFTLTTWYKMPENTTGIVNLVDVANNQYFWGNLDMFIENPPSATSGNLKVHLFDNGGSSTGTDLWAGDYVITSAFNQWNQVGVTYDDATSTAVVYYNGAPVGTATSTGFAPLNWTGVSQMVFGTVQFQTNPSLTSATGSQPWASYLVGAMEHVRIYNTVLTAAEASALYNLEKLGR
ncbi:MAG TPA: LamG domain-containing protein [Mucilaginibacter sp.]|jgi:hypothetical protein|nr:LamG domain-containing protein [Mucilaginibacter sp.]